MFPVVGPVQTTQFEAGYRGLSLHEWATGPGYIQACICPMTTSWDFTLIAVFLQSRWNWKMSN